MKRLNIVMEITSYKADIRNYESGSSHSVEQPQKNSKIFDITYKCQALSLRAFHILFDPHNNAISTYIIRLMS